MRRSIRHLFTRLRLQDYANIVVIVGLPFAIYTFYESNNVQSANFMLEFNKELRQGENSFSGLIAAIDYHKPILAPKGRFTLEQLDNYLVEWELLNTVYSHRLISRDMIYDAFSYDVENAYCHPEIVAYVKQTKQDLGSDEYRGFEDLAKRFLQQDKTDCSKINAGK